MAKKQLRLTYALKNGEIVHISNVDKGLACGCICPACGERLVAKKGEKMMHHFAHESGSSCEYGYESSLHLAAKDILLNAKQIVIPAVYLEFPYSYKEKQLISDAKQIEIEKIELEKRCGDIVPDIVVYAGGKEFFIEIYVTHKIDDEKLKKIKRLKISTIEIDLSKKKDTVTTEELTDILLNDSPEKSWKYNVVSQKWLRNFYKASDKKDILYRGFAMHVDYCPINTRMWKGKSFANYLDDCLYCDYCTCAKQNDVMILCSGKSRIATIKDFSIPEEIRIKDSDEKLHNSRESAVHGETCPYCGCRIVKRSGPYGDFWGCSNYPHCDFKTACVPETGAPQY